MVDLYPDAGDLAGDRENILLLLCQQQAMVNHAWVNCLIASGKQPPIKLPSSVQLSDYEVALMKWADEGAEKPTAPHVKK